MNIWETVELGTFIPSEVEVHLDYKIRVDAIIA